MGIGIQLHYEDFIFNFIGKAIIGFLLFINENSHSLKNSYIIPIYFTLDHSVMKAIIKKVLQNGSSANSEV